MKQFRKSFRKIILLSPHHTRHSVRILANPLAFLCQFIHPGGIVYRPAALDPAASHFTKLSRHFLSHAGCLLCSANFCDFLAELDQDRFTRDGHLHRHRQPGSLRAGANSIQV